VNWERYGLKAWIEAAQRRTHHNKLEKLTVAATLRAPAG
jgi:hypothetical protein